MPATIQIGTGPGGVPTYLVGLPPEHLPAVRHAELDRAWHAAHQAAAAGLWGEARDIVFRDAHGTLTRLAITDEDARCWAAAIDRLAGLHTVMGLSLCLRLLALIDLLGRAPALASLYDLEGGAAELHPVLLRAAATLALNAAAGFDEATMRRLLAGRLAPPSRRDAGAARA